ncbi:MAG: mechanosensitive ion channel family protein [Cyanobacteria bacterium P01_C01_bin.121]
MNPLIQEVKGKLIVLAGQAIFILPGVIFAVVLLLITRAAANLVRQGVIRVAAQTIKSLSLRSLLVQTSYVATWVIGVLISCIVAFPDLNLSDLIALLGLGSVAIGFAFQDIFKNFLAGILLLLQEPFSIGDQIVVDGFEGTVKDIALRSTQILTYQGELVVMPNSVVFTSPVQVMTGKPQRRTDLAIGVDYNTSLPDAIKVLFDAATSIEEVKASPNVEIDITGFGDSAIDLVVRYWTNSEQKCVRRVKTQMILALKRACDQENIVIPYPIRTVYHFDQEKYNDHLAIATSGSGQNT